MSVAPTICVTLLGIGVPQPLTTRQPRSSPIEEALAQIVISIKIQMAALAERRAAGRSVWLGNPEMRDSQNHD